MQPLVQKVESAWPLSVWGKTRVLVAVSGGADSVALLHALNSLASSQAALGGEAPLFAAHFNHGWRGDESDEDARFVARLGERLGIPVSIEAAANDNGSVSEAGARESRYGFLARTAYALGCRYVVTAHTRSDRIETILHNLFRGTGLSGMIGPQRSRPFDAELVLVRPLLDCSRDEVLEYLAAVGEEYRSDSSNADQRFRRNYIRHTVLPTIREQYGPAADSAIANFSEIAEEAIELLSDLADDYLTEARQRVTDQDRYSELSNRLILPSMDVQPVRWPILQAALLRCWRERDWPLQSVSRQHWLTVRELFELDLAIGQAGRNVVQLPGGVSATRQLQTVRFERQGD